MYLLADDGFSRIRVGIGPVAKDGTQDKEKARNLDLVDYVIGGVSKSEKELLEDSLTRAAEAAASIVTDGIDRAMNKYNIKAKKEKPDL